MTKASTPFKMFYVDLPEAKPFSAKKVRCYVDLETGNVFGSKEVVSRFLHKNEKIRNSVNHVMTSYAQTLLEYYWNKDNKGVPPIAMIRGTVVKQINPEASSNEKHCGKNSKLEFVLL